MWKCHGYRPRPILPSVEALTWYTTPEFIAITTVLTATRSTLSPLWCHDMLKLMSSLSVVIHGTNQFDRNYLVTNKFVENSGMKAITRISHARSSPRLDVNVIECRVMQHVYYAECAEYVCCSWHQIQTDRSSSATSIPQSWLHLQHAVAMGLKNRSIRQPKKPPEMLSSTYPRLNLWSTKITYLKQSNVNSAPSKHCSQVGPLTRFNMNVGSSLTL